MKNIIMFTLLTIIVDINCSIKDNQTSNDVVDWIHRMPYATVISAKVKVKDIEKCNNTEEWKAAGMKIRNIDAKLIDLFNNYTEDKSLGYNRVSIAHAMWVIGHEEFNPYLIVLLEDESESAAGRWEAAFGLGEIGSKDVIIHLKETYAKLVQWKVVKGGEISLKTQILIALARISARIKDKSIRDYVNLEIKDENMPEDTKYTLSNIMKMLNDDKSQ